MASYNEFCCRAGGSNLNSGTRNGGSSEPGLNPDYEYLAGSWDASTGVFTVASGNPQADGVQVGDLASIYVPGSTNTGFVSPVTAVDSTSMSFSVLSRLGTAPTTGTRDLRIGGAWLGHNGAGFPITLINIARLYWNNRQIRVNFKNDRAHNISSGASLLFNCCDEPFQSRLQPCIFEGYANTFGDGGITTIQGNASGASYILWRIDRGKQILRNLWFDRNGSTGSNALVTIDGTGSNTSKGLVENCIFTNGMGEGLRISNNSGAQPLIIVGCVFNNNNLSGSTAGYTMVGRGTIIRSISKGNGIGFRNIGSLSNGITSQIIGCISSDNTIGFGTTTGQNDALINCISYNDTSGYIVNSNTGLIYTENCIAVNCTEAIKHINTTSKGFYHHRRFTTYNATNRFAYDGVGSDAVSDEEGQTLDIDPFMNASSGDFRLNSKSGGGANLIGTAYDTFRQITEGAEGTVSYKNVGAIQSAFMYKRYILNRR